MRLNKEKKFSIEYLLMVEEEFMAESIWSLISVHISCTERVEKVNDLPVMELQRPI